MGLIITGTEDKKILYRDLSGQEQEVQSVYARVEYIARPNGTTMECAFPYIYMSKEAMVLGASVIATNIPTQASGEVVEQSLLTAHELCLKVLTDSGYEVVIDL